MDCSVINKNVRLLRELIKECLLDDKVTHIFIIFAEDKAALGQLKASFLAARLHYLCINKIMS